MECGNNIKVKGDENMSLMPTGNDDVWMIRVRDRGKLYKIDLLEVIKKSGITTDAYGTPFPENQGEILRKKFEESKKPKSKK